MQNSKTIKQVINSCGLKPNKRLGQNFLICQDPIKKALEAAELNKNDVVLEVGPGLGALTLPLAKQAKQVIAVEKDKGLTTILTETLKAEKIANVEVVNDDILNFQFSPHQTSLCSVGAGQAIFKNFDYKVIANLPYNIAAAVVMKFLEAKNKPELMVVMLQKEVAQRMCAAPPKMNKLAVFTQLLSQAKIIGYIPKQCFYPQPKVDSAILKLTPAYAYSSRPCRISVEMREVVRAGFSHPRKQLINNLSKKLKLTRSQTEKWLKQNKISPQSRAEALSLNNWQNLASSYPDCFSK